MAKKQAVNGERGWRSAKAKREAVLRLLRGEAVDATLDLGVGARLVRLGKSLLGGTFA